MLFLKNALTAERLMFLVLHLLNEEASSGDTLMVLLCFVVGLPFGSIILLLLVLLISCFLYIWCEEPPVISINSEVSSLLVGAKFTLAGGLSRIALCVASVCNHS